jgi:hypothetical protein
MEGLCLATTKEKLMTEPVLLPVKPGTLNAKDKATLRKAGVIVIEHDNPSELRLLRPSSELDGGDLLRAALTALMKRTGTCGNDQREAFAVAVHAAVMAKASEA